MSQIPKIYVAGHRGMVGSAIVRQLLADGHPASRIATRTHAELDLTDQAAVRAFFESEKPDQVYLAAAKVGGIHANNTYPAEFIYQNLMMEARLNKALRLNRVPRVVARVLRELDRAGLHDSFTVIGTQALYAYEAVAGSHFLLELLASGDVDLLYDTRQKMTVVSEKLDGEGLLGLLKKADKTFECVRENGYRAANAGQFMIDLVIAPRGMQESEKITFPKADLVATEVPGLQWLLNTPKLDAVAIDEDGWPVPMRVPDPRAFALHKAWLSGLPEREPLKKPRDLEQARSVAKLVVDYMPHLPFDSTLTSLHGDVRNMLPTLVTPDAPQSS